MRKCQKRNAQPAPGIFEANTLKIRFQLMLTTLSKISNKSDEEDGDDNSDIP